MPPGWVRLPEPAEAVLIRRLLLAAPARGPLRARSTELRVRPLHCIRGEAVLVRGVDHGSRPPRELRWLDVDGEALALPRAFAGLGSTLPLTLESAVARADWIRVAGAAEPDLLGGVVVESGGELRFHRRPTPSEHAMATALPAPIAEDGDGAVVVVASLGRVARVRVRVAPDGALEVGPAETLFEGPVCRRPWVH